jgi:D-arabinose 1-dehydrogenase-like Zn-dependent alcohol dehydrogenase
MPGMLHQSCKNRVHGDLQPYEKAYGGYSTQIVVDENYTLKVSPDLLLESIGL